MFKLIILAKRKPGISMDEFRHYYEEHHAVLAQKLSPPLVRRYVRNYLFRVQGELSSQGEAPFDCVTETWFDSEADYRRTIEGLAAAPDKIAILARDEENLFDRSKIWWFTSVQCESVIP